MDEKRENNELNDLNTTGEQDLRAAPEMPEDDLDLLHEPEEEPTASGEAEPVKPVTPAATKKGPTLMTRLLRWALAFLIMFGLGAALVVFLLYLPARQNLAAAERELRAAQQEVQNVQTGAEQEAAALQDRINELQALETRNQELTEQARDARLHVVVLGVLNDVYRAQLALAQDDATRANLALTKTGEKLAEMADLLPEGQSQVVADMQDRLDLALAELTDDVFAAQSDLLVLVNMLQDLENTYFASP